MPWGIVVPDWLKYERNHLLKNHWNNWNVKRNTQMFLTFVCASIHTSIVKIPRHLHKTRNYIGQFVFNTSLSVCFRHPKKSGSHNIIAGKLLYVMIKTSNLKLMHLPYFYEILVYKYKLCFLYCLFRKSIPEINKLIC